MIKITMPFLPMITVTLKGTFYCLICIYKLFLLADTY